MTLKTRLILLFSLVALFLVVTPYLVFYSLGYRIDFEDGKIAATGGIYIRIQPPPADIAIDEKISETTGLFSNSVFVQNLMPGTHRVQIKKDGYYDYQKNIIVKEKEVTKLENVILFSTNIPFEVLPNQNQFTLLRQAPTERFAIRNTNLYYSAVAENAQLTTLQKNTPLLRDIIAFKVSGASILWLGSDGLLKSSDLLGQNTTIISDITLKIDLKKSYTLEVFSQNIFLKEANTLFLFDQATKSFTSFYDPVKDLKISPDGQKIAYFNERETFIYYINNNPPIDQGRNYLLQAYPEKVLDLYWLNSDYIILSLANKIIISEIDNRGNVNSISLPEVIPLANGKNVKTEKPEIFFDHQVKKLYILTQNQLISSDKILP